MKGNSDYVLITPIKNEESYVPLHAESILSQSKLPSAWVFVDGGSRDNTVPFIQKLSEKYSWIHVKHQENFSDSGGHINFSYAVWEGYKFLDEYCRQNNFDYDFVAKLDADTIVSKNFFEYLLARCKEDPKLGCVSGRSFTLKNMGAKLSIEEIKENDLVEDIFPSNEMQDKRLYRKTCLDSVGGFPITKYAPDTVLLAKIRLKEWKIKCFQETTIINLRGDSGIERDTWRSSKQMGKARYYLDYHPLLILGGMFYLVVNKKKSNPLAFLAGYIESIIKREEIIDDDEIREYFRKKRLKETFHQIYGI